MAIIYTYPKLTNPQGNELIVVSDVNNKNATRLITIASIASLVPSGGGCATAITGVVDNIGNPLYTPPACSEMQLISSDASVTITSTGTGIDLTVNPALTIQCATADAIGGITATSIETETPEPADSGNFYPVQIISEGCTAVVRVPESSSYVLPCATVTTLGGIKAPKVTEIEIPPVSSEGNYYPVETISTSDPTSDAECRAVVKVPDAPAVNDGILTITVDGTPNTFTANQAGNTNVSITTGGSSGSTDNGFTPLSIYDGKSGQGAGVQETLWCQTVVEDACVINKVDYGAIGGNSQNLTVALYKGTLDTVAGSSATLIGWGEITTTAVGINTIDLSDDGTSSGNDIVIEAGDDIVIAWSKPSTVGGLLGKGTGDTPAQFWLGQILTGFSFTASDLTLGETVSATQGNLSEDPPSNANVYRLSWHFYKDETSNPTQRFEYQKCASAEGTACTNMPAAVILEAEQSLLLDYLILENSANRNESCCYFKVAESTATVTPNMSIKDQFENCDSLPDECVE